MHFLLNLFEQTSTVFIKQEIIPLFIAHIGETRRVT